MPPDIQAVMDTLREKPEVLVAAQKQANVASDKKK